MDGGRKKPGSVSTSSKSDVPVRKPGIGRPETSSLPAFQPVRKKGWSDAQFAQSKKFWEKKSARQFRELDARRVRAENTFMGQLPQARKVEPQLSDMKPVTRSKVAPMPNANMSVLPSRMATKGYKEVMSDIGDFLNPNAPVRSKFNDGGPQLIQQFTDPGGVSVTRRVGVDVEPSGHVQSLRPHLNLQTQYDGTIQGGALQDPHHPVRNFDPFGGARSHPLKAMLTSDERRAFMERYIHSLGIPIKRE